MNKTIVNCPHCDRKISASEQLKGKTVECPSCHGRFKIASDGTGSMSQPPIEPNVTPAIVHRGSGMDRSSKPKPKTYLIMVIALGIGLFLFAAALWGAGIVRNLQERLSTFGNVRVTGELFFTTVNGDVKKGAGQKVYLCNLSHESRSELLAAVMKTAELNQEWQELNEIASAKHPKAAMPEPWDFTPPDENERKKHVDAKKREFPRLEAISKEQSKLLDRSEAILYSKTTIEVQADGDGKFVANVPAGNYLLWTRSKTFGDQQISWCTEIEASATSANLVLNEEHIFFYQKYENESTRLWTEIAKRVAKSSK